MFYVYIHGNRPIRSHSDKINYFSRTCVWELFTFTSLKWWSTPTAQAPLKMKFLNQPSICASIMEHILQGVSSQRNRRDSAWRHVISFQFLSVIPTSNCTDVIENEAFVHGWGSIYYKECQVNLNRRGNSWRQATMSFLVSCLGYKIFRLFVRFGPKMSKKQVTTQVAWTTLCLHWVIIMQEYW